MYGDFKPLVPNFLSAVIKIEGKKSLAQVCGKIRADLRTPVFC